MDNTEKDEIPKMDRHHFSGAVTSFLGCNHPEIDGIWELNNKKADAKTSKLFDDTSVKELKKITTVPFSK